MTKGKSDEGVVWHAGFPNAAEDQQTGALSLDALLVRRPASTFFWRIDAALPEFGWEAGALAVVDRSLAPRDGDVIVAVVDDAFTLRRYRRHATADQYVLWGVVTHVVHEVRGR